MSDKFSEVLTTDYLLFTSKAFENKQRSIIRVDPSSAQLQPKDNFSHHYTRQVQEIQSDQPFRPFFSEQFKRISAEMNQISEMVTSRRNQKIGIIRKKQRDILVNKTIKRIRQSFKMYASFKEDLMTMFNFDLKDILMLAASAEYERNKYIQERSSFRLYQL